jgi:hypothetical protein
VVAANGDYTTSQVTEGSNLYYTDARARAAITLTTTGSSGAATYSGGTLNIPTYTLAGLGGQPALSGTGFVKISGTTISYDNSTYVTTDTSQTISGAKTFSALLTAGNIKATYLGFPDVNGYSTGIESASDRTLQFKIGSGIAVNIATTNDATFYGKIIKSGGTSSQFLKADGSVDSSTYLTSSSLSGYVSGSGTTNYISKFTASGTIGSSLIFDNGTNIGLNTTTPIFSTGYTTLSLNGSTGGQIEFKTGDVSRNYIYSNSTDLRFYVNGGAFRFENATGLEVGHSTSQGLYKLDVNGTGRFSGDLNLDTSAANTQRGLIFRDAGTVRWQVYKSASNDFRIYRQGSSNDALVIGTNDAATFSSSVTATQFIAQQSNSASSTQIQIVNSSNASTTTKTAQLLFTLADTANSLKNSAYIRSVPDGVNVLSAGLAFATRSGDTEPTTKMTLNSAGRLLLGDTTDLGQTNGVLQVTSPWGMSIINGGQALRLIRSGSNTWDIGQGTFTSQTGFGLTDITAGVNALFIQQGTCNFGIKTTAPSATLHVNGDFKTGNPGLGSAGAIKLGQRWSGTAITAGGYLPIDIDGTTYYINLFSQTP